MSQLGDSDAYSLFSRQHSLCPVLINYCNRDLVMKLTYGPAARCKRFSSSWR